MYSLPDGLNKAVTNTGLC